MTELRKFVAPEFLFGDGALDMVAPYARNFGAHRVLASGYSANGQARRILTRGCVGFLQKPFNLTDLSGRRVEALGQKAL